MTGLGLQGAFEKLNLRPPFLLGCIHSQGCYLNVVLNVTLYVKPTAQGVVVDWPLQCEGAALHALQ